MQKYCKRNITNLIIIFLLIAMPTSVFAVQTSAKVDESIGFSVDFDNEVTTSVNFAPGDSVTHVMEMENTSEKRVGLYFYYAEEEGDLDLDKVVFSIYINDKLYKRGNETELNEELVYVMEQREKITQTTIVTLDESAGNYYQEKEFKINWHMKIAEYVEEEKPDPVEPTEEVPTEKPTEISPEEITGGVTDVQRPNNTKKQDKIIIEGDTRKPKEPITITGQIMGYIRNKVDDITGNVDNIMIVILVIVVFLALIEILRGLRWLIIILLNLRNTKIYVRVYDDNDDKFKLLEQYDTKKLYKEEKFKLRKLDKENITEEKYKLVKKIKTRDEDEITLDLNKLAEQYKTNDLKIIFNKHISKQIDKSKITIHIQEQSFNYDAEYDKKPIELDVKI